MHRSPLYALALLAAGCAAPSPDEADAPSGGDRVPVSGDHAARIVLALVNSASFETLDVDADLDRRAAENIVTHRQGADGLDGTADDDRFDDIPELDGVPYVGASTLEKLHAYALTVYGDEDEAVEIHGVTEGSEEAAAILSLANTLDQDALDDDVGLDSRAAANIVAARAEASIATLAELDAIGYVGASAFEALLAYAVDTGALSDGCEDGKVWVEGVGTYASPAAVAGDLDAAEAHGRRALALHRAAGFVEGEANLLVTLGNVVGARGDLAGGAELLGQGLAKLRALRRPLSVTIALLNTGIMLARLGRRAEARPLLEESLGLARRMADPHLEAYGLGNLGLLLVEDGLPDAAEAPLRRAVEMAAHGGWRAVEGSARGSLAEVLVARAELAAACEELDLAVDAMAGAGHRIDELRLLVRAAEVRVLAGDDAGADLRADRARALARALGDAAAPFAPRLGMRSDTPSSPRG